MKKRMLVATLGTSPAVITIAIDLLSEQGLNPDSVCIIKTIDADVNSTFELLSKHIPNHCGIKMEEPVEIQSFKDIDSTEGAIEFMRTACNILKKYRNNFECYVCIAGGRKVMSALLVLAVKLYGAEKLFHIWAPPCVEEDSDIRILKKCEPEFQMRKLHPELEDLDRPHMVDLPLTDA